MTRKLKYENDRNGITGVRSQTHGGEVWKRQEMDAKGRENDGKLKPPKR